MRPQNRPSTTLSIVFAATLLVTPSIVSAQAAPAPGPRGARGGPGPAADLIEMSIQNADSLNLTTDQLTRLEDFRAQSLERTATARELVEAQRAQMEEERAQADSAASAEPGARRGRRAGPRPEVTPEFRDAMQTLADERRAATEELRSTLTVTQMEELQQLARPRGGRVADGRAGMRRPGVRGAPGGRFSPGKRPGRFGPGPAFGPNASPPGGFRR